MISNPDGKGAMISLVIVTISTMIGAVTGIISGFALSSTALSPFIIGGIVGFIASVLFAVCFAYCIERIHGIDRESIFTILKTSVASTVIGAGFAAAAGAIFPGVFATWWALAVGAGIGAISLPLGFVASETIIEFIVEKAKEYLPSKEGHSKEGKPGDSLNGAFVDSTVNSMGTSAGGDNSVH